MSEEDGCLRTLQTRQWGPFNWNLFHPLDPEIRISILICFHYTFPIEVVGRN